MSKRVSIGLAELLGVLRTLEAAGVDPALQDSVAAMLRSLDLGSLGPDDRDLVSRQLASHRRRSDAPRRASGFQRTPSLRLRERETLDRLLTGASEKEIAACLGISAHTVHQYVKRLYRFFGVTSRAQLMAACLRRQA